MWPNILHGKTMVFVSHVRYLVRYSAAPEVSMNFVPLRVRLFTLVFLVSLVSSEVDLWTFLYCVSSSSFASWVPTLHEGRDIVSSWAPRSLYSQPRAHCRSSPTQPDCLHVASTNTLNPRDIGTIVCWNAHYISADNRTWFSLYNMHTPSYVEWTHSSLIWYTSSSSYHLSWTMCCCELTKFFCNVTLLYIFRLARAWSDTFWRVQTCLNMFRHVQTWLIHYNQEIPWLLRTWCGFAVVIMFKMVKPGLQPVWLSTSIQLHPISHFAAIPGVVPAWGGTGNLLTTLASSRVVYAVSLQTELSHNLCRCPVVFAGNRI